MNRVKHIFLRRLVSLMLCLLFGLSFGVNVYADAGEGSLDSGGCKTGNCYSPRSNGAFWVKFPAPTNDIPFYNIFNYAPKGNTGAFTGCKPESDVFVLVSPLSKSGMAAKIDSDAVRNYTVDGSGTYNGGGSSGISVTGVSVKEARDAFMDNEAYYAMPEHGAQKWKDTQLGWFCAEPEDKSTTKISTTTTTSTPDIPDTCGGYKSREKADTKTRIAVENMTVDGISPRYASWTTHAANRGAINSDSGWTAESASVFTIAKPGDSVRFLHAVCMATRYGRKTASQDSWGSAQSHDTIYTLPAQHFKITGFPTDKFAFGNGIPDVNSQAASVTAYENLFHTTSNAIASPDRYGIATISPWKNNGYNCSSISDFSKVPHTGGGFQIPGFDTRSCASSDAVGNVPNLVGTQGRFGQKHNFNALKIWEDRNHDYSGSCSCGNDSATFGGNRTPGSFEAAHSSWGYRWEYDCKPKQANNCNCTEWNYDEYGNKTSCKVYSDYDFPYTDKSFTFLYHTTHRDYGEKTKTATVYTPYNFLTEVHSSLEGSDDLILQGTAIDTSFDWSVLKRENNVTSPTFKYATVTPPGTKVQMIEFMYDPNDHNTSGSTMSPVGPCAYFSDNISCAVIEQRNGNQNEEGYYKGKTHSAAHTRTIPDDDEFVGFKYCVAVGFYPSDSHNFKSNTVGTNSQGGIGMNGGTYWNISGASCRTIAKKPSVQVWNGSIYTKGNIKTSLTKKMVNAHLHTAWDDRSGIRMFGSWTDYAIIAGGSVKGMGSGADLGFNNSGYTKVLNGSGHQSGSVSDVSELTIANQSGVGNSGVDALSSINTSLNRLYSRYSEKAASLAQSMNKLSAPTKIVTSDSGFQFVYANNKDISISSLSLDTSTSSKPNYNTINVSGNITKGLSSNIKYDNTLVIFARNITIDKNICLGACGNDASKLNTHNLSTNAAAKLPQVIIIATGNINIKQNVTRIDAWLISRNGTLDTCIDSSTPDATDAGGNGSSIRRVASYHTGPCGLGLVVNGPVFTNAIKLHRTAGAHHGWGSLSSSDVLNRSVTDNGSGDDSKKGSVAPAEIFNMRADTYLWAYNQAQRSSEAVVTYIRELAPRY